MNTEYSEGIKEEIGVETERRFLAALEKYGPHEPIWFLGVEKTSGTLDMRGVDFIAQVKYSGRREVVQIPIQVKSSSAWVDSYYEKHRHAKEAGVVMLIVKQKDTQHAIRSKLFGALAKVRNEGRLYDDYLALITRKPIRGAKALATLQAIEGRRQGVNACPLPDEPQKKTLTFLMPPVSRLEMLYYKICRIGKSVARQVYIPVIC